jgi:hypothetical protein
MAKRKKTGPKPRQGADAPGALVGIRMSKGLVDRLDRWRKRQEDKPARPEAGRRLIQAGLNSEDQ